MHSSPVDLLQEVIFILHKSHRPYAKKPKMHTRTESQIVPPETLRYKLGYKLTDYPAPLLSGLVIRVKITLLTTDIPRVQPIPSCSASAFTFHEFEVELRTFAQLMRALYRPDSEEP